MLNFFFEIGIVLLLFSLFKRNKGTFFFMKFSILIIAIPVLFVCSFFYLGTEETLKEAMPGIAIWRCAFILLASLLLLGLSTLISHLSFRNLFNKEQKRKILMIESIVYLVLSIGFMATWIYDVFWSISRLILLCGKSAACALKRRDLQFSCNDDGLVKAWISRLNPSDLAAAAGE